MPQKKKINNNDLFVYISDIPWQDIKQRQHHISNQLSKYKKTLYFCSNSITKLFSKKKINNSLIIKQLFLFPFTRFLFIKRVNFFISFLYLKFILRNKKFTLILSHPSQKIFLKLKSNKIIYDFVDSASEFKIVSNISSILKSYETYIINKSDYVFAPSQSILNNLKASFNKELFYIPNSVNIEDFSIKNKYDIPKDIKHFSRNKMVGFYGAINELFDINLIKFIAEKSPDIYFIIIGPIFIDISNLPSNIIFLGKKDYSNLIEYLYNIKLWIIPFIQTKFTEIFNPVKVYEYLASERYIVSTYLPELKFMKKFISITDNYNSFYNEIIKNIDRDNTMYSEEIKKLLYNYTWENNIKKIIKEIEV